MRRLSKRSLLLGLVLLGLAFVLGTTHARWDNTVEPEMLAAWRAHDAQRGGW